MVRCFDSCDLSLLLGHPFLNECVILHLLLFLVVKSATFEGVQVTAALKTHGRDEPLDFRSISGGDQKARFNSSIERGLDKETYALV